MPTRDPVITSSNSRKTGKDQGRIVVVYRDRRGRTFAGSVVGVATPLTAVAGAAVTPQGTAGTTTYRYVVTAVDAEGGESLLGAGVTTSTGNATLNGTNFNRVTWTAKTGAVSYKVYGRTGTDTTVGLLGTATGTTFDDTGAATPGAVYSAAGTDALRIYLPGVRVFKNVVPHATAPKQTHVYFLR